MANNFLQFNPGCSNQESDTAYGSDSQRSGGASSGATFASPLANKLFFQLSTFVTAFTTWMWNNGGTPVDGSASPGTAITLLAGEFNSFFLSFFTGLFLASAGFAVSFGASSGYIRFPTSLGGWIIQYVKGTTESPPPGNADGDFTTQLLNWPIVYPTACLAAFASTDIAAQTTTDLWYQTQGFSTSQVRVIRARSHNDAGREGDYNCATTPYVVSFGH